MSSETTSTTPTIALKNVGLCYKRKRKLVGGRRGEFWALRDVSLELYRGETLGVIGRNGSGKTTLLKILAGILHPDRGEIITDGGHATLLSLQVGFLPYLSGRQNIILSGLLLGMKRREIEEKMNAIIAFAELEEFIDEPIQTYSAGMKARLGFSTAFQIDPEILLIDEVLGVGDAEFVKKSSTALREKVRSDKTVVLVSHNANTVLELCDRAVWIEKGVSRLEGNAEEVLAEYKKSLRVPRTE